MLFFFFFSLDNTSFNKNTKKKDAYILSRARTTRNQDSWIHTHTKKGRMGPYPSLSSGTWIQSNKSEMNASPNSDYKKPKYWRADYMLGLIKSSTSTTNGQLFQLWEKKNHLKLKVYQKKPTNPVPFWKLHFWYVCFRWTYIHLFIFVYCTKVKLYF